MVTVQYLLFSNLPFTIERLSIKTTLIDKYINNGETFGRTVIRSTNLTDIYIILRWGLKTVAHLVTISGNFQGLPNTSTNYVQVALC